MDLTPLPLNIKESLERRDKKIHGMPFTICIVVEHPNELRPRLFCLQMISGNHLTPAFVFGSY